jgi:hypothetical protein
MISVLPSGIGNQELLTQSTNVESQPAPDRRNLIGERRSGDNRRLLILKVAVERKILSGEFRRQYRP